ncbi:hypothetical protein SRS16CHR_00653 [Variovorax sp. SRS16]|uniref:hypothetical protein n=1 Tax=Variovorax sp. SRS16 TaxID=282217 RepID=UPI0013199127|nr:hypothetical protein [Variovorax sp. SRS16]VTU13563.1 hypothetical protein SRS16CHR_00653 [Variovorax sp. SRS16]
MKKLVAIAAAVAAIAPFAARAESTLTVNPGASSTTATARLDFSINVPKMLFLQIGTGTSYAANGTVNNISFDVPAGSSGSGASIAGAGGDLAGGGVTVRVMGNTGNVSISNTVTGPLSSGVAGAPVVQWSDIVVTAGALATTTNGFTNAAIAHPAFNTGASGGQSPLVSLTTPNGVVRREGSWTFAYANTAFLPAGTYGTSANNGRVTYTAAAA